LFDIAAVIGAIQVHTERLPVDLSAAGFFRTYKIINEIWLSPWKERFQNIADIEPIIRALSDDKKKRIIDEGLSKCNTQSVNNNRWVEDSARFIQLNGEIITDAIDANDNVKTFSQTQQQAPLQAQTPPRPMAAIAHQGNGGAQYINTGGRGASQTNSGAGKGGFQNNNSNNNNNYNARGGFNNQHQFNNTPQGNNQVIWSLPYTNRIGTNLTNYL